MRERENSNCQSGEMERKKENMTNVNRTHKNKLQLLALHATHALEFSTSSITIIITDDR